LRCVFPPQFLQAENRDISLLEMTNITAVVGNNGGEMSGFLLF
jgi:hypothetical protein